MIDDDDDDDDIFVDKLTIQLTIKHNFWVTMISSWQGRCVATWMKGFWSRERGKRSGTALGWTAFDGLRML